MTPQGGSNFLTRGQTFLKKFQPDTVNKTQTAAHAAIVFKEHTANSIEYYAVDSSGQGIKINYIQYQMLAPASPYGTASVYRLKGYNGFAKEAQMVACRWAKPEDTKGIPYSIKKSLSPVFHTSSYGLQAQRRAQFYAKHKNTPLGPPSQAKYSVVPPGLRGKKGMFCSMFVIACYQAAIGVRLSSSLMALDSKNTSPMKLESYLVKSVKWQYIGHLNQRST
ncbi:MAG: hypothetical protein GY710_00365 [Desulfobacteraceae bacterium]|nr:hypothetical protein [Desulfobacteraceae bacterium]